MALNRLKNLIQKKWLIMFFILPLASLAHADQSDKFRELAIKSDELCSQASVGKFQMIFGMHPRDAKEEISDKVFDYYAECLYSAGLIDGGVHPLYLIGDLGYSFSEKVKASSNFCETQSNKQAYLQKERYMMCMLMQGAANAREFLKDDLK